MSKVTPEVSSKVEDVSTISKKFGKKTWIRKKNGSQHIGGTVDENKTASKSDDIPNNSAVKSSQTLNQKSLTKKKETKSKIQKLSASKPKLKMVKSTEVPSIEPESTVKISTLGENGPVKENRTKVEKPTKPCTSDSKPSQTLKNGAEQQSTDIPKKKKRPKVKKPKSSKNVNQSVLQEVQNNLEQSLLMSTTNENPEEKKVDIKLLPKKPPKVKKCWYFKIDGFCRFGKKCRYLHVTETNEEKPKQVESKSLKEKVNEKAEVILPSKPGKFDQIKPTKIVLKTIEIGTTKQQEARNREIAYFQTRFDGTVVTEVLEGTQLKFQYTSTNPEWVFDVKTITMILELKPEHPVSNVKIEIEQAEMPGPLHQYLKKKLNEMLRTLYEDSVRCDSFDLIGKWFVRQLDQYLLEMFVIGLKRTQWLLNAEAAGIKVTVFDKPAEVEERKLTTIEVISKQEKQGAGISAAKEKEDNFLYPSGVNFDENSAELTGEKTVLSSQPSAPTVKIQICVNWQDLEQTIGTISLVHFSGTARCLRCSNQEFFEVSDGKEKTWPCKKCSSKQSMNLESDIGHQNSNVLANCHPIGCRPVDLNLQSSKLKLTCFNCSKELIVEALPYGAPFMTWCRKCNMKLKFVVDSISFRGNFVAIPQGKLVKGAKAPKTKPLKNSLIITPGTPLPKNGTCNHYGKSFRWFRFPCCGKLYPCDLCHNEAETDHEMKLAARMICGFCSTEQPFSKDSCNICKGAVTKIRSTFWEGGKGCRDQKAMCKNDPRKYKNTSKTIPKKRTGQTSNKKSS